MSQHASWVSYSGSSRIVLALILLIVAAAVATAGARLPLPATLPRPGRITTYALLTVWVVVIFAFLSVLSVLAQQAQQAHPGRARVTGPGPIAPVTYRFFCFASILVVFAIWARYGFGYPNTSLFYSLNVVSKLLAFATALTLFLPQRASAIATPPAGTNVPHAASGPA